MKLKSNITHDTWCKLSQSGADHRRAASLCPQRLPPCSRQPRLTVARSRPTRPPTPRHSLSIYQFYPFGLFPISPSPGAMASREAAMGGMAAVRSALYSGIIKRNSIWTLTLVAAGFAGTNAMDSATDSVWGSVNKGKSWAEVQAALPPPEADDDDDE